MGSTVLVVEHDAETIRAADHVIDLGPSGGRHGGHVVSEGPAAKVLADPKSPTARALQESARVERPKRPMADAWIELRGARANNLHDVTFRVPVGRMCVVAGVSGSGKSTLVRHVFYPALRRALKLVAPRAGCVRRDQGREGGAARAGRRPVAHRSHATQRARDVPRRLGRRAQAVRVAARGQDPGLQRGALLVQQRQRGRPLPGVRRAGDDRGRDAVPAGRRRALRGLRWLALRAVDARGALRRAVDRRPRCTFRRRTRRSCSPTTPASRVRSRR